MNSPPAGSDLDHEDRISNHNVTLFCYRRNIDVRFHGGQIEIELLCYDSLDALLTAVVEADGVRVFDCGQGFLHSEDVIVAVIVIAFSHSRF